MMSLRYNYEGACIAAVYKTSRDSSVASLSQNFLDRHHFFLFRYYQPVDLFYVLVGAFLDFFFAALPFVFGKMLGLLGFLQMFHCVAADVANGYLRLFAELLDELHDLLATLFGERWQWDPDHRAVIAGI